MNAVVLVLVCKNLTLSTQMVPEEKIPFSGNKVV